MNKIDLKNKVAIVTGGAQGFGLAIVEKFLASDAKVIIWDKDKEMMSALNLGDNVHTLEVDVTNLKRLFCSFVNTIKICYIYFYCINIVS